MTIIEGIVVRGRELGHRLGFPTANILVSSDLDIENGVYISSVEVDGVRYKSMSNLGNSPTVSGAERRLETHIFDFEGNLYGRSLRVELYGKIRDEQKFDSLEALVRQIEIDKTIILKINN